MDFQIPLRKEDLMNPVNDGQFRIEELLSVREIIDQIQECRNNLEQQGPVFILDNFNVFYSCIMQYGALDSNKNTHATIWKILRTALASLVSDLNAILVDDDIDSDCRNRNLTVLKMTTYVVCQYILAFESDVQKSAAQTVNPLGKGKKKPVNAEVIGKWDWGSHKMDSVVILQQLVDLPLHRLWDPPVIEEDFLNMIGNVCYKFLENSSIKKSRPLMDSVFNLLGSILKKHNHVVSVAIKIVQMLQVFEHLTIPLAQCVLVLIDKFGMKNILSDIIMEIGNNRLKEYTAGEGSGTRCFSQFLAEVAKHTPQLILSNMSVLATHLEGESHSMRNCVLGIMGEILVHTLGKDSLDDKARTLRDQFLDCLEDHLRDVNALVRSKVLQILIKLCTERIIPIARQEKLLKLSFERLQDKTCSVRKSAIQFLTAMLQSNPYAATITLDELRHRLQKEKSELALMCPGVNLDDADQSDEEDDVEDKRLKNWNAMKVNLKSFLKEKYSCNSPGSNNLSSETLEAFPPIVDPGTVERICKMLDAENFEGARLELEKQLKSLNPSAAVSGGSPSSTSHESSDTDSDSGKSPTPSTPTVPRLNAKIALLVLQELYVLTHADLPQVADTAATNNQSNAKKVDINDDNIKKGKIVIAYLKDCIRFSELIHEALPLVNRLLGSRISTDVLEAIMFFVTAVEFGVQIAQCGIRSMITLIWSKDDAIKSAVLNCYRRLYLNPEAPEKRQNGQPFNKYKAAAENLSTLTRNSTVGQLASLQELMFHFVTNDEINEELCEVLWKRFSNPQGSYSPADGNAAVLLLGMIGSANSKIIKDNINMLVTNGLGDRAMRDFQFANDVCAALLNVNGNEKPSVESRECPFRISNIHDMFTRIVDIIVNGITFIDDNMFVPFAERAVSVIYKLAENPDIVCEDLLKKIVAAIMQSAPSPNNDASQVGVPSEPLSDLLNCSSAVLSRFLAIVGQIALMEMVHLDVNIFCEMKRRNFLREESKKQEQQKKKQKNKRQSLSASLALNRENSGESTSDELGLMGATVDDSEAEYIRKVCDKDLVTCESEPCLLGSLAPLIVKIASNEGKSASPDLLTAATAALTKFMMVSCDFCEANMLLLVTILEKSPHPTIRGNCVIAIGDLACRFPNTVDPYISNVYTRLHDDSFHVRYNAITILMHLILHDMTKVRGQISEMALCVVDADDRISGLARLFFQELSGKGNSIYNVLPDIISHLSHDTSGSSEEIFQTVLKYLLPFIQKDKLVENMVEKLCNRFKDTRSERQWRNLSFCLSLLCTNEKCFQNLYEHLPFYAEALSDNKVFDYFSAIIESAKKLQKPEIKLLVDELEQKIGDIHNKGLDDNAIVINAAAASRRTTSRVAVAAPKSRQQQRKVLQKGTNTRITRKRLTKSSESENSDTDKDSDNSVASPKSSTRAKKGFRSAKKSVARKRPAVPFFSSDDSD